MHNVIVNFECIICRPMAEALGERHAQGALQHQPSEGGHLDYGIV